MPRPRWRLTPDIEDQILPWIRSGAYPHVAAEAAGIPARVFRAWLRRGAGGSAREPYRGFALRVMKAAAMARVRAEIDARAKQVRFWLANGPGRDRSSSPGWSAPVRAAAREHVADGAWRAVWAAVRRALAPYAQARAAAVRAVESLDGSGRKRSRNGS